MYSSLIILRLTDRNGFRNKKDTLEKEIKLLTLPTTIVPEDILTHLKMLDVKRKKVEELKIMNILSKSRTVVENIFLDNMLEIDYKHLYKHINEETVISNKEIINWDYLSKYSNLSPDFIQKLKKY